MKLKPDNMTWWDVATTIALIMAVSAGMLLYRPHLSHTPYDRQQEQLQQLIRMTSWRAQWRQPYLTDAHSTWYEKLRSDSHPAQWEPVAIPLDVYGHPLVYEPPTPANGQRIFVRSVGSNGIDDNGRRDDLQAIYDVQTQTYTMPQRNFGYWIATHLPEPLRWAYFILSPTAFGLMIWAVFCRTDQRYWNWIKPVVLTALILSALAATPVLYILAVPSFLIIFREDFRKRRTERRRRAGQCLACGYDLRGSVDSSTHCPECGAEMTAGVEPAKA